MIVTFEEDYLRNYYEKGMSNDKKQLFVILLNFPIIKTDMVTIPGIEQNMIVNNIFPFEPTHPGELLLEEFECRNISQAKFSERIGEVFFSE